MKEREREKRREQERGQRGRLSNVSQALFVSTNWLVRFKCVFREILTYSAFRLSGVQLPIVGPRDDRNRGFCQQTYLGEDVYQTRRRDGSPTFDGRGEGSGKG